MGGCGESPFPFLSSPKKLARSPVEWSGAKQGAKQRAKPVCGERKSFERRPKAGATRVSEITNRPITPWRSTQHSAERRRPGHPHLPSSTSCTSLPLSHQPNLICFHFSFTTRVPSRFGIFSCFMLNALAHTLGPSMSNLPYVLRSAPVRDWVWMKLLSWWYSCLRLTISSHQSWMNRSSLFSWKRKPPVPFL